ncbi:MAG: hypothetical protein RLY89_1127 [Bacteroidota bacterium]|jgi:hypothetical protein
MKIRKISIFLATFLGAILALTSCTKNDGPITNRVTINDIPAIQTKIDASGSQAIDLLNLASFNGKFTVSLYFADATGPSKVDVVVRKNGSAANVKVFKAGVTTLPATFSVTSAELATLFGTPVALGDTYDFAPNIYIGDRMFEAFPATGNGTGAGVIAMPGFSEFSRFAAICAYDPAIYQGNFVVVSDGFGDFTPGEVVPITKVDNTTFSFIDPYATSPLPIIVKVNTLNNQLSVTKQKIGNAFVWNLGYTNPNVAVTASASSFVAPCSKTITLAIAYTVDQGSFGTYNLVLRKP